MKTSSVSLLGIDIAKLKFDACLRLADGRQLHQTFSNHPTGFTELLAWLRGHGADSVRVGLEATGSYWIALAERLHAQGLTVCLLNPAYVKSHAQATGTRTKTDRVDARLIADYVAKHDCECWQPLPAQLAELRELMRLHADVLSLAVAASQRGEGLRTSAAKQLQAQLAQWLKDFTTKILKAARQHASQHTDLVADLARLQSIPGVGEKTALRLVCELPRGRKARSVAAWAGVTPRQRESGTSVKGKPKMCKQGSDYVRQTLYWPAITALRCCPIMQAFAQRLEQAGLAKMQIIGAIMHKLLRWVVGVLRSNKNFDPSLHAYS